MYVSTLFARAPRSSVATAQPVIELPSIQPLPPEPGIDQGLLLERVAELLEQVSGQLATLGKGSEAAVPVATAAARLGCSRARVFELLKKGKLQAAKKVGKKTMVVSSSIEEMLLQVKKAKAPKVPKQPSPSPRPPGKSRIRDLEI